mmetsp:Transcript_11265/g.33355  ORF Transcript_11265/g.33355 Transcript_11265/m.33355 type:complete len:248 (+) Transcript_11265:503-1246(+)
MPSKWPPISSTVLISVRASVSFSSSSGETGLFFSSASSAPGSSCGVVGDGTACVSPTLLVLFATFGLLVHERPPLVWLRSRLPWGEHGSPSMVRVTSRTSCSCCGAFSFASFFAELAQRSCSRMNSRRRVVIFILFFGVRSPWRMTASTASNSSCSQRSLGRDGRPKMVSFSLAASSKSSALASSSTTPPLGTLRCSPRPPGRQLGTLRIMLVRPVTFRMWARSTEAQSWSYFGTPLTKDQPFTSMT